MLALGGRHLLGLQTCSRSPPSSQNRTRLSRGWASLSTNSSCHRTGVKAGARIGERCSPPRTPGLVRACNNSATSLLCGSSRSYPSAESRRDSLLLNCTLCWWWVVIKPRARLGPRACFPRASRFKDQSCSMGASSPFHPVPSWNLAASFPTRLVPVQREGVQL